MDYYKNPGKHVTSNEITISKINSRQSLGINSFLNSYYIMVLQKKLKQISL